MVNVQATFTLLDVGYLHMKDFFETLAKIGITIIAIKVLGWILLVVLIIWVLTLIF